MSNRKKSSTKHIHQHRSATFFPSAPYLGVPAGIVLIIVAVFIAYLPSINGGFVLDDDWLLTKNDLIKASDGLYRIWFTNEAYDYWPVTNTTLWIEWRLWGMNPTGYHVTNLILHIVESLLIWMILRKLSIPGAFLAAVLFAVHPVNVESVAWISQRKNLMAMLFFLLSILWYVKSEENTPGTSAGAKRGNTTSLSITVWYWLSLAAFALAMLSKGSVAVLPVVLLGIIWWLRPLTRWDLIRTAPFFLVSMALTAVNLWFQTHGAELMIRSAGYTERLLGAGGVVWFYLHKALLPVDLAFVYPQWQVAAGNLLWWLPIFTVLFVTAILWFYRKGWSRSFLLAWGFFCVSLAPVLGFTDVAFMKYSLVADHYQHIAIIGVIALAAAGLSSWYRRTHSAGHRIATTLAVAAVTALTFLTWQQSGLYRDAITLFQSALKKNPAFWLGHNNLGNAFSDAGRLREAIEQYEQALRLNPNYVDAYNNLGNALNNTGRLQEAIILYQRALLLKSDQVEVHYNLGHALIQVGRLQEGIDQYQQALKLKPNLFEAQFNLGTTLVQVGRIDDAIEHFKHALRLEPNDIEVLNNLGIALSQTGRQHEAIECFKQCLQLKPDYINAYNNLALTYALIQRSSEAIAAAQKAVELSRAQDQPARAKRIEDWLNAYKATIKD